MSHPPDPVPHYGHYVLATMVMWSDQCPKEEVLELAARNFSFAAMEAATVKINEHEDVSQK